MIMAMFETVRIDGVDYRHESPADCARSAICALLNGESGSVSVSIEVDLHPVLFGEMIKAGHLSAFRNPDMANYLNVRGFMEMTGRGSVLIQEACRANGLPEPQWVADDSSVTLTFFAKKGESRILAKASKDGSGKEKSVEKILRYLSANPRATQNELSIVTGLSVRGVEKNLKILKESGQLLRVGADKGGHWEVVKVE